MDQELRDLVATCAKDNDRNPLWPDGHTEFCKLHDITADRFYHLFAKHVAEEFSRGEMSYTDGDAAMNCLFGIAGHDFAGFALDIYEAFDAGEFFHDSDPPGTIPWQKYTLPYVMKALNNDGLPPCAQQFSRGFLSMPGD